MKEDVIVVDWRWHLNLLACQQTSLLTFCLDEKDLAP